MKAGMVSGSRGAGTDESEMAFCARDSAASNCSAVSSEAFSRTALKKRISVAQSPVVWGRISTHSPVGSVMRAKESLPMLKGADSRRPLGSYVSVAFLLMTVNLKSLRPVLWIGMPVRFCTHNPST